MLPVDEQIEAGMAKRRQLYSTSQDLGVFTATWNVANSSPFDAHVYSSLVKWLFAADTESTSLPAQAQAQDEREKEDGDADADGNYQQQQHASKLLNNDLVVIALQEIVNLENPYNLVGDLTTFRYYQGWADVLLVAINDYHAAIGTHGRRYELLAGANLVGMAIFAFVPAHTQTHTGVQSAHKQLNFRDVRTMT